MTALVTPTRQNLESTQNAKAIAAIHAAEELTRTVKARKPSRAAKDIASNYVGACEREAEAWARYRSALDASRGQVWA